jgi:hypothetical protein
MSIRAFVLSDLHFGEPNSVLTTRAGAPAGDELVGSRPVGSRLLGSGVMDALVAGMRALSDRGERRPTLVLNGDVLELALGPAHVALDVFDQFVARLFPADGAPVVDDRVVLLPGNHDHDLWRVSRDEIEARAVERADPAAPVPPADPVTPIFGAFGDDPVPLEWLTRVVRHRHPAHPGLEIVVASPNAAIPGEGRVLALHHGHFTESTYVAMTRVAHAVFGARVDELAPADLERDNGAWIDFLWSSLGREGFVGASLRRAYDLLNTDTGRALLASRLAVAAEGKGAWPLQRVRRAVAGVLALRALDRMKEDELRASAPDEPEAAAGVIAYLDGPLARSLDDAYAGTGAPTPTELVFLYGHTHKPYAARTTTTRFPAGVRVYNTGGWVIDVAAPRPSTGGGLLVVGDDLDVALVHCFDQSDDPGAIAGSVEHADGPDVTTPLTELLRDAAGHEPGPWRALADAAREEVAAQRAARRRTLAEELEAARVPSGGEVALGQVQRLARRQQRIEHKEHRRMHPRDKHAWLAQGTRAARGFFTRG